MKRIFLGTIILAVAALSSACGGMTWQDVPEGTVEVKTMQGKVQMVLHPGPSPYHNWWGDEYWPVSMRSTTVGIDVTASTKDNAALYIHINVTFHVKPDDAAIILYVQKFGLDNNFAPPYTIGPRDFARDRILTGQANTEAKNAIAEHDAYSLLTEQESIRQKIEANLKPIFDSQLHLELESVQIIGRPDFMDDRIEQAASAVVANQKMKEASQAGLEADRVEAERKQVQATIYANPTLLEIRKLELQKDIAAAWAAHQGALVFGSAQGIQISGGK